MNFAGYVTYTVGGFNHRRFAVDGSIRDRLSGREDAFDVKSSLAVRPGQVLFRRQCLLDSRGNLFAYSAYIGTSEITQSRNGSFIGLTIVFESPTDALVGGLGAHIYQLAKQLSQEFAQENRFFAAPTKEAIEAFLARSSPQIDNFSRYQAGFDKVGSRDPVPRLLYTSQEIAKQFDLACAEFVPGIDFYLTSGKSKSEFVMAATDFDVQQWPPPPPPPPPPPSAPLCDSSSGRQGPGVPGGQAEFAAGVSRGGEGKAKGGAGMSELDRRELDIWYRQSDQKWRDQRTWNFVLVGLSIAVLLLSAGGVWSARNKSANEVAQLKNEIALLRVAPAAPVVVPATPVAPLAAPAPPVTAHTKAVTSKTGASVETIRSTSCATRNAISTNGTKNKALFNDVFFKLNPHLNKDPAFVNVQGTLYSLPDGCAAP